MKTVAEVKAGLVTVFKSLKKAQGYAVDLPDANIKEGYSADYWNDPTDTLFPKCQIVMMKGRNEFHPGLEQTRFVDFAVFIGVKKQASDTEVITAITEKWINAVEDLLLRNSDLNGVVHQVNLEDWETDGGTLDPEGVVVFVLRTERRRYD